MCQKLCLIKNSYGYFVVLGEIPGRNSTDFYLRKTGLKILQFCFLQFQDTFPKHQLVQQTTNINKCIIYYLQTQFSSKLNANLHAIKKKSREYSLALSLSLFCIILAWDGNKLSISSTHFVCIFSRIVNIVAWWWLNVEYETNLLIWLLKEIEGMFVWY